VIAIANEIVQQINPAITLDMIKTDEAKQTIFALKEMGVVVDDEIDENAYYRYWRNRTIFESNKLELTILVTTQCNLSCPYCFQEDVRKLGQPMASDMQKRIYKWVDGWIALNRPHVLDVTFFGGEPTLEVGTICSLSKKFYELSKQEHIYYLSNIITNGTLLTNETIQQLNDAHIAKLQVTLDGPPEFHDKRRCYPDGAGSFATIFENLAVAVDIMKVGLTINFDKQNILGIPTLLKYLKANGFDKKLHFVAFGAIDDFLTPGVDKQSHCANYIASPLEEANYTSRLHTEAIDLGFRVLPWSKTGPCRLYRSNTVVVDPLGDIYTCISAVGCSAFKLGNITDLDPDSDAIVQRDSQISGDYWQYDECNNCHYLPLCEGGCRYLAFKKYNQFSGRVCEKVWFERGLLEVVKALYIHRTMPSMVNDRGKL